MTNTPRPEKNGFLIYKTQWEPISDLDDVELGLLMRAIFDYQLNSVEPLKSSPIAVYFKFFKAQFTIDEIGYLGIVEQRSAAGRASAERRRLEKEQKQRGSTNPTVVESVEQNQQNQQNQQKSTNATKPTDNEKDNGKENVKDNGNEKENTLESSSSFSGFDACKAAREFETIYKKAGRRNAVEREYAQALAKIKLQYGYDHEKGHEAIKTSAAAYMTFTVKAGTEFRYMPNPETWLSERMYETNWIEKAKDVRTESPNEPKSKPLIGLSKVDELDRQREERHRRQAEEAAKNGN